MGYLKVDDFEKKQHYIAQKFCQADQDLPGNSSELFYSIQYSGTGSNEFHPILSQSLST